ncbi:hypothetical protein BpHYR1_016430, partial [Brachionus plicatilis]
MVSLRFPVVENFATKVHEPGTERSYAWMYFVEGNKLAHSAASPNEPIEYPSAELVYSTAEQDGFYTVEGRRFLSTGITYPTLDLTILKHSMLPYVKYFTHLFDLAIFLFFFLFVFYSYGRDLKVWIILVRLKLSLVDLVRLRVQKNVKKGILSNMNFLPFQ